MIAFLKQTEYLKLIGLINDKLLLIKTELTAKMDQSNTYTIDFMYQTECIIDYYIKETHEMYNTIQNKKYFNRLQLKKLLDHYNNIISNKNNNKNNNSDNKDRTSSYNKRNYNDLQPTCEDIKFSMFCYEHLDSINTRNKLQMVPEKSLNLKELGYSNVLIRMLKYGLKSEPNSWKYPLLSSIYWRSKGNAKHAVECARRALYLTPRKYKDYALLNLGTILQRSNKTHDSIILFNAAIEHSPNQPENYLAIGNALFLISEFNKTIEFYEMAKELDDLYDEKLKFLRKSMTCFKYIKMKLKQIESQLNEMIVELKNYNEGKKFLENYHDKLMSEQVPLNVRVADQSFDTHSHHLLDRSQYCSTRLTTDSNAPVLFCDFYSDLQMQLEDLEIDTIQSYVDTRTELIKRHMDFSLGIYRYLNIENFSENLTCGNG